MVMIDASGRIVLVNAETEKLFGYARRELLGQSVEVLVPERFRAGHPGLRARFFQSPEVRRMGAGRDLYGLRKDGGEFPVEIGLNPIETDEGVLVLSAIIDITERKRNEEALRDSEQRVRMIVEAALDAVVTMNERGLVTGWNPQAEATFGWRRDEVVGRSLAEIVIPEEHREAHRKGLERFLKTGEGPVLNKRLELTALHKTGRIFPVELTISPLRVGDAYEFSAFVRDITDRKELEAALRRVNEELEQRVQQRTSELERAIDALEQSNIELKQFAYIASHDLQSPLRSISGFVQLLQSEYQGKLDEQADDWIRRTVLSIRQMQTLIRDLLVYSRVDSQSQRFKKIQLQSVFDDAVSQLDALVRETGGEVTRGKLPAVLGDRSQLVQLMQNLVGNGLKYHGEQPPRIHVSAERGDREWTIAVRDNGMGIEPKYQDRVFEIFRRLHDQQEYPGTGIGLAVCRRVVTGHGGRIWMESTPGRGSTFFFTFPDRRSDEQ